MYAFRITFKSDASNPSLSVTLLDIYFAEIGPPLFFSSPVHCTTALIEPAPLTVESETVGLVVYPDQESTTTTLETYPLATKTVILVLLPAAPVTAFVCAFGFAHIRQPF